MVNANDLINVGPFTFVKKDNDEFLTDVLKDGGYLVTASGYKDNNTEAIRIYQQIKKFYIPFATTLLSIDDSIQIAYIIPPCSSDYNRGEMKELVECLSGVREIKDFLCMWDLEENFDQVKDALVGYRIPRNNNHAGRMRINGEISFEYCD